MIKIFVPLVTFVLALLLGCAAKKELSTKTAPRPSVEKVEIPDYYFIIKPQVNVRHQAAASAALIGELSEGDSVRVVKNSAGWYNIITPDGQNGWIRSDLLGPRHLSVFPKAVHFADSLKEAAGIDLFFDKKLAHKRIYMTLSAEDYRSKADAEIKAKTLLDQYQEKVYPGDVTLRVLQQGSDAEYVTIRDKGEANADIILPVLPFGQTIEVEQQIPGKVMLTILTPQSVSNDRVLAAARKISGNYPLSYRSVGLKFITSDGDCRMWFQEDKDGELYKFGDCP